MARSDFERAVTFFGTIYVDGDETVEDVVVDLQWTQPGPTGIRGRVHSKSVDQIPRILRRGSQFEARGRTCNGKQVTVRYARLTDYLDDGPSELPGISFELDAGQVDIVEPGRETSPIDDLVTVRLELIDRNFLLGNDSDVERRLRQDWIWSSLERATHDSAGPDEYRSRTPLQTPVDDVEVVFDYQKYRGPTLQHGVRCRAEAQTQLIYLMSSHVDEKSTEQQLRELTLLAFDYVFVANFLERTPPPRAWRRSADVFSSNRLSTYERINPAQPRRGAFSRDAMAHGINGDVFNAMVAAYRDQKEDWRLKSALLSYFTACEAGGARATFLNLYLALESVLAAYADKEGLEFWLPKRSARKHVRRAVRAAAQEWLRENERDEQVPQGKANDFLRLTSKQLQYRLVTDLGVEMEDMGLEGEFTPDNSGAFPWVKIRNQLFHTNTAPASPELIVEAERLQIFFERIILRILGVDRSVGLDPDKAFQSTYRSYPLELW